MSWGYSPLCCSSPELSPPSASLKLIGLCLEFIPELNPIPCLRLELVVCSSCETFFLLIVVTCFYGMNSGWNYFRNTSRPSATTDCSCSYILFWSCSPVFRTLWSELRDEFPLGWDRWQYDWSIRIEASCSAFLIWMDALVAFGNFEDLPSMMTSGRSFSFTSSFDSSTRWNLSYCSFSVCIRILDLLFLFPNKLRTRLCQPWSSFFFSI